MWKKRTVAWTAQEPNRWEFPELYLFCASVPSIFVNISVLAIILLEFKSSPDSFSCVLINSEVTGWRTLSLVFLLQREILPHFLHSLNLTPVKSAGTLNSQELVILRKPETARKSGTARKSEILREKQSICSKELSLSGVSFCCSG